MYFSSQLSWTCYWVHRDRSTKHGSSDRNRGWREHKSQHTACYWTIIFIFLFHSFYQHVFYLQSVSYPERSNEELPRLESCEDFLPQSCSHLFCCATEGKDRVNPTLVLNFGRAEYQYICTEVLTWWSCVLLLCLGWIIWLFYLLC